MKDTISIKGEATIKGNINIYARTLNVNINVMSVMILMMRYFT